jgi:hypothetical protein
MVEKRACEEKGGWAQEHRWRKRRSLALIMSVYPSQLLPTLLPHPLAEISVILNSGGSRMAMPTLHIPLRMDSLFILGSLTAFYPRAFPLTPHTIIPSLAGGFHWVGRHSGWDPITFAHTEHKIVKKKILTVWGVMVMVTRGRICF